MIQPVILKKNPLDMSTDAYGRSYWVEGVNIPQCCEQDMLFLEDVPLFDQTTYTGWFCDICGSDQDNKQDKLFTIDDFWDCSCAEDYLHSKTMTQCQLCNSVPDESPDARRNEVMEYLHDNQNNQLVFDHFHIGFDNSILLKDFLDELSFLCRKFAGEKNPWEFKYETES